MILPPCPTFLFSASSNWVHLCESLLFCPGDPSWVLATQWNTTFYYPPRCYFWMKDHAEMLLLKKKEKKRSSEDKFLVSIWAEECQSNEQVGWKCSFWCKSTNPWLSELKISWQEWNVVSLLFQYIKLKFKIMNSKLFRPNVQKKSDK